MCIEVKKFARSTKFFIIGSRLDFNVPYFSVFNFTSPIYRKFRTFQKKIIYFCHKNVNKTRFLLELSNFFGHFLVFFHFFHDFWPLKKVLFLLVSTTFFPESTDDAWKFWFVFKPRLDLNWQFVKSRMPFGWSQRAQYYARTRTRTRTHTHTHTHTQILA